MVLLLLLTLLFVFMFTWFCCWRLLLSLFISLLLLFSSTNPASCWCCSPILISGRCSFAPYNSYCSYHCSCRLLLPLLLHPASWCSCSGSNYIVAVVAGAKRCWTSINNESRPSFTDYKQILSNRTSLISPIAAPTPWGRSPVHLLAYRRYRCKYARDCNCTNETPPSNQSLEEQNIVWGFYFSFMRESLLRKFI